MAQFDPNSRIDPIGPRFLDSRGQQNTNENNELLKGIEKVSDGKSLSDIYDILKSASSAALKSDSMDAKSTAVLIAELIAFENMMHKGATAETQHFSYFKKMMDSMKALALKADVRAVKAETTAKATTKSLLDALKDKHKYAQDENGRFKSPKTVMEHAGHHIAYNFQHPWDMLRGHIGRTVGEFATFGVAMKRATSNFDAYQKMSQSGINPSNLGAGDIVTTMLPMLADASTNIFTTFKGVERAMSEGLNSPLTRVGGDLHLLGEQLNNARATIAQNTNYLAKMSFEDMNNNILQIANVMHSEGMQAKFDSAEVTAEAERQYKLFSMISQNTGITAAEVAKFNQKNAAKNADLAAVGILSDHQAKQKTDIETALDTFASPAVKEIFAKLAGRGVGGEGLAYAKDLSPEEQRMLNMIGGLQAFTKMSQLENSNVDFTKGAGIDLLRNTLSGVHVNIGSNGQNGAAASVFTNPALNALAGGINRFKSGGPAVDGKNVTSTGSLKRAFDEKMQNGGILGDAEQLLSTFGGLVFAIHSNTVALMANTAAQLFGGGKGMLSKLGGSMFSKLKGLFKGGGLAGEAAAAAEGGGASGLAGAEAVTGGTAVAGGGMLAGLLSMLGVGALAAGSVWAGKKTLDKGIPWWTMIPGGELFASKEQLLGKNATSAPATITPPFTPPSSTDTTAATSRGVVSPVMSGSTQKQWDQAQANHAEIIALMNTQNDLLGRIVTATETSAKITGVAQVPNRMLGQLGVRNPPFVDMGIPGNTTH